LIGQLLLLTELESGDQRIKHEPIPLAAMLTEIVADAEFEARALNRAVRLSGAEAGPLHGDERLLRSAIENVVRNAIRHTAASTTVEVTFAQEPQTICITVRDYGPGVPANALAQLFRPFYRVDEGRDRHSGGTGLGLSITARAIHLHGGRVEAANAPDQGLLVTIRLPFNRDGDRWG
jgi:two-component system sensor histidine kinase CpxA